MEKSLYKRGLPFYIFELSPPALATLRVPMASLLARESTAKMQEHEMCSSGSLVPTNQIYEKSFDRSGP